MWWFVFQIDKSLPSTLDYTYYNLQVGCVSRWIRYAMQSISAGEWRAVGLSGRSSTQCSSNKPSSDQCSLVKLDWKMIIVSVWLVYLICTTCSVYLICTTCSVYRSSFNGSWILNRSYNLVLEGTYNQFWLMILLC